MAGIRALQKEKTRQALINAAFNQLTAEKSFANLSLREVSREAGIAPTSFYRHFKDMEELGLTMVDEAGLTLRQLMRQAQKRLRNGGSVIEISIDTFFEFIENDPNVFRLLLRESAGISLLFRTAVSREIKHFIEELGEFITYRFNYSRYIGYMQAEASVTLTFSAMSKALDMDEKDRAELKRRVILQLRMIAKGAQFFAVKEKDKTTD
ncbi:HTH-type transcriptional repressor FabR [Lonepinella sp. MS14435]|uniref:HTH-type transcriptional repressor FabR n=1 Tax=unclassified Lonepinella TaxID=2642006 RepID=UPI0036DCC982